MRRIGIIFLTAVLLNSTKAASQLSLKPRMDTVEKRILIQPLPQNFYNQSLGYFCKKENQLQKLTALPLFIRLGSKEYVDYLERKPNAVKKDR